MKFSIGVATALSIYIATFTFAYWKCNSQKGWEYSSNPSVDIAAYWFYKPIYIVGRNADIVKPHWRDPVYDYSRLMKP
jgi:hypothetical protein